VPRPLALRIVNVLAISGAGSDSGKTTFVVAVLRAFPGWGALKTSPFGAAGHHHGGDRNYELVIERERLLSPGRDTRSYLEAGAARAAWLIAKAPLDPGAAAEILQLFAPCAGLAVEGGSLAEALSPGRRYVIVRAGTTALKPEAASAVPRADALLVNAPAGTGREEVARTVAALAAYDAAAPILEFDPATPADPGLARVLSAIRAWARC
jgi:hypothetical protein